MRYIKFLLPPVVLLAIVLLAFGRTFGSYFLADDFGEICYCSKIAEGNLQLLLSNFTGNYMQIATMNVYRPCLLLSLLFDFLIWKTSAIGYFLTNILFMFGTGCMLYVVLRSLTVQWGELESIMASLFAAALFVSNPLHSEAVSFVVGRVDIICAFFYLLSYWCFIKRGSDQDLRWLIGGVLFFWIAMLTKEMAIGLPILLSATAYILPELFLQKRGSGIFAGHSSTSYAMRERFEIALKTSAVLWINTLVYFVVRFLALGTLTGGYGGSIGAGQFSHLIEKWRDLDTIKRILYPLNLDAFGQGLFEHSTLTLFYLVLLGLVFCRIVILGAPWRWIALLSAWMFSTVLPIYQLWGLSENLEGSRFLFFFTIPLSALAPFLILAPPRLGRGGEFVMIFTKRVLPVTMVTFSLLVIFLTLISYKNNIPWLHAGRQTRACQEEAIRLAAQLPGNKQMILLGLPKEHGGAHMILNGITFDVMLSPPFTSSALGEKFVLFEPVLFGSSELIDPQRLKECLSDPRTQGINVWDENRLSFQPALHMAQPSLSDRGTLAVSFPSEGTEALPYAPGNGQWHAANGILSLTGGESGSALEICPLKINPYDYDFIEFDIKRRPSSKTDIAQVLWAFEADQGDWHDLKAPSQRYLPANSATDFEHCRLPLSHHWSWFTNGFISNLQLKLPAKAQTQLKNLKITSAKNLQPRIHIKTLAPSNIGIYGVPEHLDLSVDASQVANCAAVQIQLSKPNFFFDNPAGPDIDEAIMKKIAKPGQQADFSITRLELPVVGFYQLRAVSLDAQGKEVGEPSGETTIYRGTKPN